MQRTALRIGLSVRPSVCLFVKRVLCDKTKETCAHILIPYERTFILVFRYEEWLVGENPFI